VRLPAAVIEALMLKEGDEIEIHVVGARVFEMKKRPAAREDIGALEKVSRAIAGRFQGATVGAVQWSLRQLLLPAGGRRHPPR